MACGDDAQVADDAASGDAMVVSGFRDCMFTRRTS
jgi:hypothetical protein